MIEPPVFPPLFSGVGVTGREAPFVKAQGLAALGCDGGTVVHNVQADRLSAAIVFAPEVPLQDAMAMFVVCGIGFQNAFGALAPPEVALHLGWSGDILINGACCGRLQVAASGADAEQVPDWLVVGLDVPLMQTAVDPGQAPDRTTLYDEGCADIDATGLLESWVRHSLVWINRWINDGNAPLHAEWAGLLQDVGEQVECLGLTGNFLGVDDRFGMLVRDDKTTHLLPLSRLLGDRT